MGHGRQSLTDQRIPIEEKVGSSGEKAHSQFLINWPLDFHFHSNDRFRTFWRNMLIYA